MMKKPIYHLFLFLSFGVFFLACNSVVDKEKIKKEIFQAEKAFEKMCAEKNIAEAFYQFADNQAVIKRQNDTLIIGKENIKKYYQTPFYETAKVNWTPDFIDVSDCGNLAYTYGKFKWYGKDKDDKHLEFQGVFHTVWKRQKNNEWKYVWD